MNLYNNLNSSINELIKEFDKNEQKPSKMFKMLQK